MARLNEPLVSTDTLETLRKKMLRQNRDLAKSNNARALRIRDLENDCACMLSENLELRGRILELEKQLEDNDARRVADHALAIKSKLEAQLSDWTALLAGLGVEPPQKRRSPQHGRRTRQRFSFGASRPSPSQRRLRDVAREIEELGHIPENKSGPRRSMNPEQILALRSQADLADSPELGPPPLSKFIDEDPVKVDSPSRAIMTTETNSPSPTKSIEPPVLFAEPPGPVTSEPSSPCPIVAVPQPDLPPLLEAVNNKIAVLSVKAGAKRKLSVRDDSEVVPTRPAAAKENQIPRITATEKPPCREKAEAKDAKNPVGARKDERERRRGIDCKARQPLAAKSTNEDLRSPKKSVKPTQPAQDVSTLTTPDAPKAKASISRSRCRTKTSLSVMAAPEAATTEPTASPPNPPPVESLPAPVSEDDPPSPRSPEPAARDVETGSDTPPPSDISASGEATRPSRRNRAAISYAEPNLRDKMRRPSKQLFDAVAGEGKNRRSSQAETTPMTTAGESSEPPLSPLADKQPSLPPELPDSVATTRRRRPSSSSSSSSSSSGSGRGNPSGGRGSRTDEDGQVETSDVDVYEFASSSPPADGDQTDRETEKEEGVRRQSMASSRRVEKASGAKDRGGGRRRSMMV
ncbi:Shugoshin [Ophiocordyceps camponoti-floridani]|uniref:Shugoshin n=1 Tax=Ophiocordyceps camponoti-floridani TaxID=2030778 RepID=A0A8H4QEA5_9HYPO|nr:Shugoshin [Ophiocordyceps camponoti-floridani]